MRAVGFTAFGLLLLAHTAAATEDSLQFGRFGTVHLYYQSPRPSSVVLFVSGDGAWTLGVIGMARTLTTLDALVAGIDIVHYLKQLEASNDKCLYPASDLEELSKAIQQRLGYEEYVTPVLVGYSSGATLVYAVLAQAPSTTFRGGVSLGFCPDLAVVKPFCRGSGLTSEPGPRGKGVVFESDSALAVPWYVLQGTVDQVCAAADTRRFVEHTGHGDLVLLPKVGHGFSVERNWLPQFRKAFGAVRAARPPEPPAATAADLAGLPLVEVSAAEKASDLMAIHLTGDGGWGVTDQGISRSLAASGIPVVGWNSLKYFWKKRTPEDVSRDLGRIISYYTAAWGKRRVVIIGYSFGADVAAFALSRLPAELRERISLLVLLGPSHHANFQFHFSGWLGAQASGDYLVLPELRKLAGMRMLCFYGKGEDDSIGPEFAPDMGKVVALDGGHRIGKDVGPVVQQILAQVSP
jgi:type IV secretory pathway VirJ component